MTGSEPNPRLATAEALRWAPPPDWIRVWTVDAHAGGEPLRVLLDGVAAPAGNTMLARRRTARRQLDRFRTALMWEPRGHADMYGCLLTPPVTPEAQLGVLFLHNEGFSTMCGHGIIAVVTVVLDTGILPATEPETELGIDTPAGFVEATATVRDGVTRAVRFRNVPSFAVDVAATVRVPGYGDVVYGLAFGGAFYAYVDAGRAGLECGPHRVGELIEAGAAIKRAIVADRSVEHPTEEELGFLYGTIFVGEPSSPDAHSRHVCVFADGEVDRSPTGTGVSGRLALLRAQGAPCREPVVIESIIGSRFTGRIVEETRVGSRPAVIPEVEGRAFLTGRHEFWIDPEDPWGRGFLLGS